MRGPYVIFSNLTNTWYDASGTGRGDRPHWVVREADATEYRTLALAQQALASKFSHLTRDEIIVQRKTLAPTPGRQLEFAGLADLARRYA